MPDYPEICMVVDALGMLESDFQWVKDNPTLYEWVGIVTLNGKMAHIYRFVE